MLELLIGFLLGVVCALAGVFAGMRAVKPPKEKEAAPEVLGGSVPPLEANVLDEWLNGPKKKGISLN